MASEDSPNSGSATAGALTEVKLTPAAFSVAVYGAYLLVNGIGLVVSPEFPLSMLGLSAPEEPWARVFGLLAGEIGFYFVFAARQGYPAFLRATVYGRVAAAAVFLGVVLLGVGPAQLLIFAAVDFASAVWTRIALKRQRSE